MKREDVAALVEALETCLEMEERPKVIELARAAIAAAQRATEDGCHCATCTCDPNMTPAVRFDLSPARQEGAIREHLIRLGWTPPDEHALSQPAEQRAEVEALQAERDALQAENKRLRAAFENLANLRASDIKKEKDAFELWITSKHPGANLSPHQNNCGIMSSTDYMHQKVQAAWDAWLARAALAQEQENKA